MPLPKACPYNLCQPAAPSGDFPAARDAGAHERGSGAAARHQGVGSIRQDILICLPERLHPVSQMFLENWLAGEMTTAEFLRWFHMPNSAYLPVAKCVLAVVAGA